jgi:hypothetical protein
MDWNQVWWWKQLCYFIIIEYSNDYLLDDLRAAWASKGILSSMNGNGDIMWWTDYEDSNPNVTGIGQLNMLKLRREKFSF